ncbi:MAG: HAMP domain-containing sensor histidine kinase [Chloroflexota bacterium]
MSEKSTHSLFPYYITLITGLGLALILIGLINGYDAFLSNPRILTLLIVLTIVTGWFSVTIPIADSSITYHLGMIPAIAGSALFGPFAAAALSGFSGLALWLAKPSEGKLWRRNWTQLGFNTGMHSIAAFCAGYIVVVTQQWLIEYALLSAVVPWLPAAIVYVEVNTWILIGVLVLQAPGQNHPLALWKEDQWSSRISVLVLWIGCSFLSYALVQFGVDGGLVFFVPILISVYAFKLYTAQITKYLDNLEDVIADRTKELESLNKEKDAFLTVLTHDMMTPLSSIRYSSEKIQSDPELSHISREYADLIVRGQKTLHNMVTNILDIERVRINAPLITKRDIFDIQELVRNVTDLIRLEVEEKEIEFDIELESNSLWVDCDSQQIERVLFNLLSNALKYTPMGGKVSVSVKSMSDPARVIVSVEDTGYGIPEEMIDTIFDKYMRVAELQNKAMGTGIGLAITKRLVEEHGGVIEVKSKRGEGSWFAFTLPLIELDSSDSD